MRIKQSDILLAQIFTLLVDNFARVDGPRFAGVGDALYSVRDRKESARSDGCVVIVFDKRLLDGETTLAAAHALRAVVKAKHALKNLNYAPGNPYEVRVPIG